MGKLNYNYELDIATKLADKIPHYEHAKLVKYDSNELQNITFSHDEIKKKKILGNVVASYRDKEGKLQYVVAPLTHQYIVGITGVGKTTGPLKAQVINVGLSGTASAVVADSKGEIYESTSAFLREQGYNVKSFNLKDPLHSELWNCFYNYAEKFCNEYKNVGSNISKTEENGRSKYIYKNHIFYSKKTLAKFYSREIDNLFDSFLSDVRKAVTILLPIENSRDPQWEKNAFKLIVASIARLVLAIFDVDKNKRTTINKVNLYNVKKIFDSFEVDFRGRLKDKGFFSGLKYNSKIFSEVKRIFFENHESTSRNFIGFVDDALTRLNFKSFMDLTLSRTVTANDLVNKKTILFLTFDEMDPLSRSFLSFFISSLLADLKSIADSSEYLRLKRNVLFIIDEFSSLPKIDDLVEFVAYGRSRGIFCHYVLQDLSQISSKYGDKSLTLKNNCSMVFLGTNDHETIQKVSTMLGKCTIVSPNSVVNVGEHTNICYEERPLVTCSDLTSLKQGDAIVMIKAGFSIKGNFEKSYECKEYACPRTKLSSYENKVENVYDKCLFDIDNLDAFDDGDDEDDDDD